MDFMHDTLAMGRSIRVKTRIDVCTRECLRLAADPQFTGADVIRLLSVASEPRGTVPAMIQCDNGTEFILTALDHWAY